MNFIEKIVVSEWVTLTRHQSGLYWIIQNTGHPPRRLSSGECDMIDAAILAGVEHGRAV